MKLTEGQKIKSISFDDGFSLTIGKENVKTMTVSMEAGREFFIPWIFVTCEGNENEPLLINCEHIASIKLDNTD